MKDLFEKEFSIFITQKKPIDENSRRKLDQAYNQIRQQGVPSKSSKKVWPKMVMVLASGIFLAILLTNQPVIAKLHDLLGFNAEWKYRLEKNLVKESHESATDQGVIISLTDNLSTNDAFGFSYGLDFADPQLLEGAQEISLNYRIKNGDGEYLVELIPDTKQFKGENNYIFDYTKEGGQVAESNQPVRGAEQFIISNQTLPLLKKAVLEIETILISYENGESKELEGQWLIPLTDGHKETKRQELTYVPKVENSQIILHQAQLSGTKMLVVFSVPSKTEIDLESQRFHLEDQKGRVFKNQSYNLYSKNQQWLIEVSFPLTTQDAVEEVTLILDEVGQLVLVPQ